MNETIPYLGQTLSLLAAVTWAFAVILFKKSGETVHPIALNLFKNLLAVVLFLPTLWIFGGALTHPVPANEYLLFMLSGVLGIGIGDTLFFKSLNRIGAGLSAIVICLYSPFIIGLSYLWLGERLAASQAMGALMIIAAVLLTTRLKDTQRIGRADLLWGIIWGVLATASMAVGIVMIKPWLVRAPLLWAIEIRLVGGIMSLVLITLFHPSRQKILASLLIPGGRIYTVSGAFVGAYLAMLVWLAGMKLTQVSIASALNQTSTLFVFLFAALFLREPITWRRTVTIIMAVSGAFLVIFG
jgi:drug/metabolite transporter (DMT)-like permease